MLVQTGFQRVSSIARAVAVAALLSITACTAQPENGAIDDREVNRDALFEGLADRDTADCTGSLDFTTDRHFEGQSSCGRTFRGHSDAEMPVGLVCVYTTTLQSRSGSQFTASGRFLCSDRSRGTVIFVEEIGDGPGVASVSAADGRIVTLIYE
ncbi:hypothetical protein [Dongia sp.]|uniref:hypothetical protein n=1 Tax=Dongia sp. TaxID=1977262 RepID=UPI0035B2ABE7